MCCTYSHVLTLTLTEADDALQISSGACCHTADTRRVPAEGVRVNQTTCKLSSPKANFGGDLGRLRHGQQGIGADLESYVHGDW